MPSIGDFKIALPRLKLHASRYKRYSLPQDLYAETFTDYRQAHEASLLVGQRGKEGENEDLLPLPDDTFIWGPLRSEILQKPERYLLYTSSGAHTLLHFLPPSGEKITGTYIYGKAEPLKEEMELSFARLMRWVRLCGLKLEYAHTSGHMYQKDLERFVSEIDPDVLVPIYTEHPELFSDLAKDVRIPHLGETLQL